MDEQSLQPTSMKKFVGVSDNINPIVKNGQIAEVLQNLELSEDFALTSRGGSVLFDRAARLRMFNQAAFTLTNVDVGTGALEAGTYNYIARYYDPVNQVYSLPFPTYSVESAEDSSNLVQIWCRNNRDATVYTELHLYRQERDEDAFTEPYYKIHEFTTEVVGESYIRWVDDLVDSAITGFDSIQLDADGLDVDRPVAAIIDFKRRLGGNDILYVCGPYIKSTELGDKIHEDLDYDRFASWVCYQNAIFLVNGKDFKLITDRYGVFDLGLAAPSSPLSFGRIDGPLDGLYRGVFTWYDDGSVTGHATESAASPVSASLDLTNGGILVTRPIDVPPSRATHWRYYRTVSDGAIGTALLVVQLPISQLSYYDTKVDPVIGPDVAPFEYNDAPSELKLQFIVLWNDVIYGAGNPQSPSTLYWCKRGFPELWSELNNRFTLDENDGDPITGLLVVDGNLVVFKRDSVYVMLGNPPVDANKLGFKQGCSFWRSLLSTGNGAFTTAENSVYFFNGNAMYDIGDNIAHFVETEVDSTEGTMRASQMVDYQKSTKKQLIVSFKTMAKGTINDVAGVYHYKIAEKLGDLNLGWTFFTNFEAITLATVESSLDKDMLLLGDDVGNIYLHDSIKGHDRAEIRNFGAEGAPFLLTDESTVVLTDTFASLAGWSTFLDGGSFTFDNVPAGTLHLASEGSAPDQILVAPAVFTVGESCRLEITNIEWVRESAHGTYIDIKVPTGDGSVATCLQFFIGTDGVYSITPSTDGSASSGSRHLPSSPVLIVDTLDTSNISNITIEVIHLWDGNWNKFVKFSFDGVVVFSGLVGGTVVAAGTAPFVIGADSRCVDNVIDDVEFTIESITFSNLAERATGIEQFIDGEPIEYIYESPWLSFDDQDHLQKFFERLQVIIRANQNGDVRLSIFSDLVLTDPFIVDFPVNGGTMWDITSWDKGEWDGKKRTVNNRVNISRTGNHFKIRIECSTLGAHLELFGLVPMILKDFEDNFNSPRGNEGVAESTGS